MQDLDTVKITTYNGAQGTEMTYVRKGKSKIFESFILKEPGQTFKAGKFNICSACIAKPGSVINPQMQIITLCQNCNP